MTKIQYLNSLSTEEFSVVSQFQTKAEIFKHFGLPNNGTYTRLINQLLIEHNITLQPKQLKYPIQTKICPVCTKSFDTYIGRKDEKTTCSHSCSNTYFNGVVRNTKPSQYTTICFKYHKKECVICGESRIVEVHHYDENHQNNSPENLIPLCPTHHRLFHSRYRQDVESQINHYHSIVLQSNQ